MTRVRFFQGSLAYDKITRRVVEIVGKPPWAEGKLGVVTADDYRDCYIRAIEWLEPLAPLEALSRQADE